MTKKLIYHGLFILNFVLFLMVFVHLALAFNGYSREELETLMFWRMILTYFVFAFFIWNIVIWTKRDKKVGRFLALFFLPGLYTLFYYRIVLKNKWLDKQE
jgi:hypothetical protein